MDWLTRSRILLSRLPIRDRETHRPSPFNFYPSQVRRYELMKRQWEQQGYIRIIDLKSRRVGFSSQTEGFYWCRCFGFDNQNIKILAHLQGSADELFRVPQDFSRAFPGFPHLDIQQKKIYFRHRNGDSILSIGTAGTPSAGRGGTLSMLHLSEASKYLDPEIFVAMISSVAKGPGSCIVIESTANGREGPGEAFFNYWNDAVKGKNGYIANFASWLDDPAFVRHEEEAGDAPQNDLEKELMAPPFNASRAQIAWMRRTLAEDCNGIEAKFLEDFPHCPEVAFQISGSPAFPRDEISFAESTVKEPLTRGRFVRTGVGAGFRFLRDELGPVHVWRLPYDSRGKADGMKYYIGADSAAGVEDGDFAAWCCLCGQTGELAARFAERIEPEVLADQLDMAGRWYGMAMVNPELTGGLGRWTLKTLRDVFMYPNIYVWKGKDDRKRGKNKTNALGFEMTQSTRRMIIDAARAGLRMSMQGLPGGLQINDRALMAQIAYCTLKEWRWDVAQGHDDILVAWAIACLTREQYPPSRMSFIPKTTMEVDTPQSRIAQLGVRVQQPSEAELQFLRETKRIRIAAGLNASMRGIGIRRHQSRLFGI
jgi:hypothetical protein